MRYAQIKGGNKLHLVFESEGYLSDPICGKKAENYRMTINVPLGRACQNCQRIYRANRGSKEKAKFYKRLMEGS